MKKQQQTYSKIKFTGGKKFRKYFIDQNLGKKSLFVEKEKNKKSVSVKDEHYLQPNINHKIDRRIKSIAIKKMLSKRILLPFVFINLSE